jgi:hypothetical protein
MSGVIRSNTILLRGDEKTSYNKASGAQKNVGASRQSRALAVRSRCTCDVRGVVSGYPEENNPDLAVRAVLVRRTVVFLCAVPAVLQAARQILFVSNKTLYALNIAAVPSFKKPNGGGNISMMLRILKYQFTNTPYRLLIHKPEAWLASELFDTLIATLRLAVFVFGSITQCSLILMPTPLDGLLFGLIVATAFLPRVLWTKICMRTVHDDTWIISYEEVDVAVGS